MLIRVRNIFANSSNLSEASCGHIWVDPAIVGANSILQSKIIMPCEVHEQVRCVCINLEYDPSMTLVMRRLANDYRYMTQARDLPLRLTMNTIHSLQSVQ